MSQAQETDGAAAPRHGLTLPRVLVGSLTGCLLGFAPTPAVAPGLYVTLVALLLLLRAPLVTVVGLAVVCKLLSLALGGVAVSIGELLLDGPTGGLFASAINAPFLALFGLEYYAVTGGYAIAAVLAVVATVLILRGRGGAAKAKGTLRPVGVLALALLVGAVWLLQSSAAESVITAEAKKGLARLNGATVDLTRVDIDLADGRLTVEDLAMANPRALNTDLFHGLELTADVGNADLLRKRLHVESLVIRQADSGKERGVPGVLVGAPPEPELDDPEQGERSIEDYLKDWEVWRERLGQAREWIEKLGQGEADGPSQEELPRALRKAEHLIEGAPSLLVSEVRVEDLSLAWLQDEAFSLTAANLSSAPSLVDGAMSLSFATKSDLFGTRLVLPKRDSPGRVSLHLRGLEVDRVASMLRLGEGSALTGGTIELSLDGPWMNGRAGYIDLPLDVTLRDVELALGGSTRFPLSELRVPVHLRGPLDGLNLKLDHDALIDSLRAAGAAELTRFVEAEKERLMAEGMAELQGLVDDEVKDELQDLLGTELELDLTDLDKTQAELTAGLAAHAKAAIAGTPKLAEYLSEEELATLEAEVLAALEAEAAANPEADAKTSALKIVQDKLGELGKAKLEEEGKKALDKELKKGLEKLFGGG